MLVFDIYSSCLFVCNHIVFSHLVAMTKYLIATPLVVATKLMGKIAFFLFFEGVVM
jgi:hypothetical protein